jgi:hypothetical protein
MPSRYFLSAGVCGAVSTVGVGWAGGGMADCSVDASDDSGCLGSSMVLLTVAWGGGEAVLDSHDKVERLLLAGLSSTVALTSVLNERLAAAVDDSAG